MTRTKRHRGRSALVAALLISTGSVLAAPIALAAGTGTTVSVDDNFFKPKKVTVAVGDKVTWEWDGYGVHNVFVVKGPQKFKSASKSSGKFSRTIKKPGTYRIICTLHPGMEMTLKAT
jgi:plastocyanin